MRQVKMRSRMGLFLDNTANTGSGHTSGNLEPWAKMGTLPQCVTSTLIHCLAYVAILFYSDRGIKCKAACFPEQCSDPRNLSNQGQARTLGLGDFINPFAPWRAWCSMTSGSRQEIFSATSTFLKIQHEHTAPFEKMLSSPGVQHSPVIWSQELLGHNSSHVKTWVPTKLLAFPTHFN